MDQKTAGRIRLVGWAVFLLYLVVLVYLLFFWEDYGRAAEPGQLRYNLVPLREIRRFLMSAKVLGMGAVLSNLLGNVIGFVPLGAILPVLSRRMRSFWRILLVALLISACIEVTQMLTRVGVYDVDDILLNTLGAGAGYGIFAVCNRLRRKWYG